MDFASALGVWRPCKAGREPSRSGLRGEPAIICRKQVGDSAFDGVANRRERPSPIARHPKCPLAQRDTNAIPDLNAGSTLAQLTL